MSLDIGTRILPKYKQDGHTRPRIDWPLVLADRPAFQRQISPETDPMYSAMALNVNLICLKATAYKSTRKNVPVTSYQLAVNKFSRPRSGGLSSDTQWSLRETVVDLAAARRRWLFSCYRRCSCSPWGRTQRSCWPGFASASPWGRYAAAASRCRATRTQSGSRSYLAEITRTVMTRKKADILETVKDINVHLNTNSSLVGQP